MPQAIAEIEQVDAAVARQRLAVPLPRLETSLSPVCSRKSSGLTTLPPREFPFAEIQRERQLLLVGDVLIAEQQHGVFVHAGFDVPRFLRRRVRLAQIDA